MDKRLLHKLTAVFDSHQILSSGLYREIYSRDGSYFRFSTVWYKRLRNKHLTKYLKNSSNDLGIVLFLAFCGAMLSNNS
ncbi:hypothetical protein DXA95_11680 [Odoribacter sp. OF09-27XD]|nr:hypothetical protein DXA95_11680 [Odoribacter sp. OF09-27XD]